MTDCQYKQAEKKIFFNTSQTKAQKKKSQTFVQEKKNDLCKVHYP